MNLLKQKEEEAQLKVEELQGKVKTLEHENLAKEQEITSLSHKNQLLEVEVEKLDEGLKIAKRELDEGRDSGTHNEGLQRRLQLLEEEAEEADKNIRETNEKYVYMTPHNGIFTPGAYLIDETNRFIYPGFDKRMSKRGTTNAKCRLWKVLVISGRKSMKRWRKSTLR